MRAEQYIDMKNRIVFFCNHQEFGDAIPLLEQLRQWTIPKDLSNYRKLRSIEYDIANTQKPPELINEDIKTFILVLDEAQLSKWDRRYNFCSSLVAYSIIPAMPFLASLCYEHHSTEESVSLALALYCISIALSIRSDRNRFLTLAMSIFTFLLIRYSPTQLSLKVEVLIALVVFLFHVKDRWIRHILYQEHYLPKG